MTALPDRDVTPRVGGDSDRLLQNLRDYADAVFALTWQRQGTFLSMALLTGGILRCVDGGAVLLDQHHLRGVDLLIARKVMRLRRQHRARIRNALAGFITNTVVSASTICLFAIWVAVEHGGVAVFTALFSLFAAALYAAMNNHQIVWNLVIRLVFYSCTFFFITVKDLVIYRPPLTSELWLQFFTVVMVVYFLVDCSLGFLRLYRKNLDHIAELKVEHERTKAALVVKSQFVSVVSHELRTPLTSIKGSLDLINSGQIGPVHPQVRPLLDMASKNSRRLAHLIDDLLDLQKIEAGEMSFKLARVDVAALLEEAIQSHQGLAEKFNVTSERDIARGHAAFREGRRVPADAGSGQHDIERSEVLVRWRRGDRRGEAGGRYDTDLRDGPWRGHPPGRQGKGLRQVLAARLLRSASHGRNRAGHEHLPRDRGSDGRGDRLRKRTGRRHDLLRRSAAP
jgi:signal transduction histidine kinase